MKCYKCDMHMEEVYIWHDDITGYCNCTDGLVGVMKPTPITWLMKTEEYPFTGVRLY